MSARLYTDVYVYDVIIVYFFFSFLTSMWFVLVKI